jgi:hypothetical protein
LQVQFQFKAFKIEKLSRCREHLESSLKQNTVTSKERFGPVNNSKLEVGGRSPYYVTSEGNLNELKYELEFGSNFAKRRRKRCRRVCELSWDDSLYFSPYENLYSK